MNNLNSYVKTMFRILGIISLIFTGVLGIIILIMGIESFENPGWLFLSTLIGGLYISTSSFFYVVHIDNQERIISSHFTKTRRKNKLLLEKSDMHWQCSSCGTSNKKTAPFCIGCGDYK